MAGNRSSGASCSQRRGQGSRPLLRLGDVRCYHKTRPSSFAISWPTRPTFRPGSEKPRAASIRYIAPACGRNACEDFHTSYTLRTTPAKGQPWRPRMAAGVRRRGNQVVPSVVTVAAFLGPTKEGPAWADSPALLLS